MLVAAIAAVSVLVFWPDACKAFGSVKAWELVTQFFLVAILGGAVGLIYRLWESSRAEERAARNELQKFYAKLLAIHNEYKKVRRTLRASSFLDGDAVKIERSTFEELMDKIEDCQLELEGMYRQVEADHVLFAPEQTNLADHLKTMEGYLRDILRGYEDSYAVRRSLHPNDLLTVSQLVSDFIAKARKSKNLDANLFDPAEKVRSTLVSLIATKTP